MKNVITCVIVDDDSFAIKVICDHIEKLPRLKVLKTYQSSLDALAGINALGADLVFLDIDMPGLSGLSLASAIRHSTPNIIFTTAFTEYALKAFDLRAKHYLLKPIEFVRFAQEVNTVIKECFDNPLDEDNQAFYVRNGERGNRVKVLKGDIIYFQGAGNYLHIFTPTEHYTIYYALKDMERKLSQNLNFYRVHKSYIINTDFIKSIQGNTIHLQKYDVLMTAPFKEDFIRYLEDNTLLFRKD
ncbi:LytR/AlgR family response regulator transcription factor [Pedobacter sp.]|uniref:LytR/AlgR family response regulator transcription factor n=1 Tax=Pedobacter sp. TaxID=1411316 RepID=UPI003BA8E8F3